MAGENGSTLIPPGWISADELEELGTSLALKPRRVAGWRERGLIPHPTLIGHEGKRPIWAYPPDTDHRLRSIVRWKRTTRDLETIHVALWAEGFPVQTEVVRAAIIRVLDSYEQAMLDELARFAPPGTDTSALLQDREALRTALDGYANELARMRRRFPVKHRATMKLPERERGMRYWLHLAFGLERDPADAKHLEQIYGVSRGRSGTARGEIPWPPEESFPLNTPITPSSLRDAVTDAGENVFLFVSAMLQTFLYLPALLPTLLPGDSSMRTFGANAAELLNEAPAQTIALLAATLIAHAHRQSAADEDLATHTEEVKPQSILTLLLPHLDRTQARQIIEVLNERPIN